MSLDLLKRDISQMIYLANRIGEYSYEDMYNSIYGNEVNGQRSILVKEKIKQLKERIRRIKRKMVMKLERQQELFDEFVSHMEEILLKKGGDYANVDVLSNFRLAGNIINLSKEQQCLSLISMKVARLGNLLSSGNTPNNESISDNLLDLANYTFLLHCLIEDK